MLGSRLSATAVVLVLVAAAPGCFINGTAFESAGTETAAGAAGAAGAPGTGGSAGEGGGGGGNGGSTSSAGAGGTGGSVQPVSEVCTNGADDDLDGKTDCADTEDCATLVTCQSAAPAGWTGYFHIRSATYTGMASSPPDCADGTKPITFFAGPINDKTCAPCSCDWPDATCSAPRIDCYSQNLSCGGGSDYNVTATSTNCIPVTNLESCELTGDAVVTNGDTCNASGGEEMNTLPWQDEIFVCGGSTAGSGCGGGEACVPIEMGEYDYLCIQKEGTDECPGGWTGQEFQVYTGAMDQRICTACDCMTAASCGQDGSYTAWDFGNCTGSMSSPVESSSCVNVDNETGLGGSIKPKLASVLDGECGGGEPAGTLVTEGALKICCKN